eukprot:gnl/TRDRNA2_/TRDRNA2_194467_c0_seq1.p1 gnl/TRDRNA2_/TRDRNA2_194467_c0~~gnl/TRDRNA2_/TRDRNA2_194467_c0_seq1.p1  ORF type:complete len:428 (+),score=106.67 gnl/TRDRNA2_/TRDRNA2_194467_c0_seq1:112-1395(+)
MAGGADDDDLEYTLLNKRDVLVYQIPPASSSSGHKADDWKKCIWRGRLRVVGKGKDLTIKMLDGSSGQLFAQCQIPNGDHDSYVERVLDSSRYFVLKITNGARHAFIGLGFEDRNDAFDFNVSLNDFKTTYVDRDVPATAETKIQGPSKDLSLKEGQKITVNLKNLASRSKKSEDSQADGFSGLLAPPPPGGSRRQGAAVPKPAQQGSGGYGGIQAPPQALAPPQAPPVQAQSQAQAFGGFGDDPFGDFEDFQSAGFQAAPAPAPAAPAQPSMAQPANADLFSLAPPSPAPAAPASQAPPPPVQMNGAQAAGPSPMSNGNQGSLAANLHTQLEQLNLGGGPGPGRSPSGAPQSSSDPFAGLGGSGFGASGPAPMPAPAQAGMAPRPAATAPQQAPAQAPMMTYGAPPAGQQRQPAPSNAFDEFDIFK